MVKIVNIHEAKTHLSRQVEAAVNGEPFVIAKAGKPMVQVRAISQTEPAPPVRLGFMADQFQVPDDFDEMGRSEIEALFGTDR